MNKKKVWIVFFNDKMGGLDNFRVFYEREQAEEYKEENHPTDTLREGYLIEGDEE